MNVHKFSILLSVNRQCEKRLMLLMIEQDTHWCYKVFTYVL